MSRPQFPPRGAPRPSAADVRQLREEMDITQAEFGRWLYVSERAVQDWESGARRCPALTWEYASLLRGFRAVAAARKQWVRDLRSEKTRPQLRERE